MSNNIALMTTAVWLSNICFTTVMWPTVRKVLCIVQGYVYEKAPDFFTGERGWLGYSGGKLFFFPKGGDTITALDPETLKTESSFELEGESCEDAGI